MSNIDFQEAQDIVADFLAREIESAETLKSEKRIVDIIELISHLKFDTQFYALSSETHFGELWDYIRSNATKTNFTFNVLAELIVHFGLEDFEDLTNRIADAYTSHSTDSVMDDDTYDRLPNSELLKELLGDNSWAVPLYILNTLHVNDLLARGKGAD